MSRASLCLTAFALACSTGPEPIVVASLTLSETSATLVPGSTVSLTATPRDAAGLAVVVAVTWNSSDPLKASVSSAGIVTGVAAGSASITATSGGQTATASIVVKEGAVIGPAGGSFSAFSGAVSVTAPAGALTTSTMFTVEQSPAAPPSTRLIQGTAFELGPSGVTFAIPVQLRIRYNLQTPGASPERLIAIHRATSGVWQPVPGNQVDIGAKTVTAFLTSLSTYAVLVAVPAGSVTVSPPAGTVNVGTTLQLAATVRDDAGNVLTDRDIAWTSSNSAIASVSNSGLVTALSPGGPVQITAAVEGKTASASITTRQPVATVVVSPASSTIAIGGSVALGAVTRASDNSILTGRAVSWSSSNSTIASVNGSTGAVTGVSLGTVTIAATSEGVSGTALVQVTAGTQLTGSWSGVNFIAGVSVTITYTIADANGSITGTSRWTFGSSTFNGPISGTRTGSSFSITTTFSGFSPFTFTGTVNGAGTTMTGVINGSGFVNEAVVVNKTGPMVEASDAALRVGGPQVVPGNRRLLDELMRLKR